MNKKYTLIIAILTAALLTGCGSTVSTASSNSSSTTKTSSSEASSAVVTTSENFPTTSSQQQNAETVAQNTEVASAASINTATDNNNNNIQETAAPSQAVAVEMLNAVNFVERIASCGLQFDESQSYTDPNGNVHCKCTETEFDSVNKVSQFMHRFFTPDFISRDYSYILDSDEPLLIDVDGSLYIRYLPRGSRFNYSGGKITIEKSFEGGYSVLAEYDNYGGKETADLQIVFVDGHWMVSGLTLGI